MSNILFFTLPLWGHINPNVNLLKSLKEKVNLVCISSLKFKKVFDDLEIEMLEYPSCIEEYYNNGALKEAEGALAKEYFLSQYDYQSLSEIMEINYVISEDVYWSVAEFIAQFKPDLILADAAAFWVQPIAMKCQIQYVAIESATNMSDISQDKYFKKYISDVVSKEVGEYLDSQEVLHHFQILDRKKRKYYKMFAGQKRERYYNPVKVIAYLSEELQVGSQEIQEDMRYVGYDLEVNDINKENAVLVTRGTITDSYNLDLLRQFAKAIDVAQTYEVTITLGNAKLEAGYFSNLERQKNIRIKEKVNQIEELKRSRLMITHGGITGVREAVMCETPVIIFPVTFHCYQVGMAIEQEKAGIMLKKHPLDSEEVNEAINRILTDSTFYDNVRRLKEKMKDTYARNDIWSILKEFIH